MCIDKSYGSKAIVLCLQVSSNYNLGWQIFEGHVGNDSVEWNTSEEI
jgi:hypothetical protein